jgi:hypothetical protein
VYVTADMRLWLYGRVYVAVCVGPCVRGFVCLGACVCDLCV